MGKPTPRHLEGFRNMHASIAGSNTTLKPMHATFTSTDKAVILVIDDDTDVVAGLAKVLTAAGYAAHCCNDAEGAFASVRKLVPDLIISDINLGGQSGLQ